MWLEEEEVLTELAEVDRKRSLQKPTLQEGRSIHSLHVNAMQTLTKIIDYG